MEKWKYINECQLNAFAKILTASFLIFSIVLIAVMLYYSPGIYESRIGYYSVIWIMIVAVLYSWGIHPQRFILTDKQIMVIRPFKNKEFNYNDIKQVTDVTSSGLGLNMKAWGSRGVFGYFGYFFSSKIGRYYLYAGNYDHLILIEFNNGKKIIINPKDDIFYKKLLTQIELSH